MKKSLTSQPFKVAFSSNFQITGVSSSAEAQNLSMLLKSGALIAPVQIVEERTIGPSLGAQNVEQGINASFWGLNCSYPLHVDLLQNLRRIASFALVD